MKIKFGSLVVDGRGKIGGHVASKNRSGNYLRTKTTPTNPQTSFQTSVRALFGSISQGWSSLTEAQRNGWRDAVDLWKRTDIFGDLKRPTGKALYQRLNQQAQVVGYSAITDAPEPSEVESSVISNAEFDIAATELTLGNLNSSASTKVQLFGTPALSAGTKFVKNKLRAFDAQDADAFISANAYGNYIARFGTPTSSDNIYIGVKYVDDNGNATPLQVLKAEFA